MRFFTPTLLLLAGLLGAAEPTIAPAQQQQAEALVQAMGLQDQMKGQFTRSFAKQASLFDDQMPENVKAAYAAALVEVEAMLLASLDLPALTRPYIEGYAKAFTAEELQQLIAWQQTPLAQKMRAAMPEIEDQAMTSSVAQTKALMPKIQEIMQRHLEKAFAESRPPKPQAEGVTVGQPFPGFTGTTLDGKPFDLASTKGKVVLIDFWATWCGPCRAELPHVKAVYAKHQAAGFEVIGISLDEEREALTGFLQDQPLPWVQLFDGKGWESELAKQFKIQSIPATYLLGRDGKLVATDLRGDALETAVTEALAAAVTP